MPAQCLTGLMDQMSNTESSIHRLDLSYTCLNSAELNSSSEFNMGRLIEEHVPASKIERLDMMYCSLDDTFLEHMAKAVLDNGKSDKSAIGSGSRSGVGSGSGVLKHINLKGNEFKQVEVLATMLKSEHCKLETLNFSNGFAPERPSILTSPFSKLNEKNKKAYNERWETADRSKVAKLFLKSLSDRSTPTTLTDLRGVSLNLSGHLGTNSGNENYVFHQGMKDAHRIFGQDNRTILKYLHLSHYSGVERRKMRDGTTTSGDVDEEKQEGSPTAVAVDGGGGD